MCPELTNVIEFLALFCCFMIHAFVLIKVAFTQRGYWYHVITVTTTREDVILFHHLSKITVDVIKHVGEPHHGRPYKHTYSL